MVMALSQELYTHCRVVLLKCREFDSHASLEAVFVTIELVSYKDDLPASSSKNERVSKTLDHLMSKRLSDGRPVLPIFLATLCHRYGPGDELYGDLERLCSRVDRELSGIETVDIPFVIVAMTHSEANDLITETVFDGPDVAPAERASFHLLMEAFRENAGATWLSRYAEERDEWRPHTCPTDTIRAMILQTADRLNQDPQISSLICPQFRSTDFLSPDDKNRIDTWEQLGKSGCILVVDAVSLFHPMIYRRVLQSEMSSNRQVAMAILVLSPEANQANELIEQEVRARLQRAFARFDWYDDQLCQLDVRRWRGLRRWLVATLPQVAEKVLLVPHSAAREMMRKRISETHGMGNLISGRW